MPRSAFAEAARPIEIARVRQLISSALLLATLCMVAFAAKAQTDETPAATLYRQAVSQSERASNLERRGKFDQAIDAYEATGQVCEAAIAELDAMATPPQDRSPDIY